jgi:hypothetical protein
MAVESLTIPRQAIKSIPAMGFAITAAAERRG